MKYDSVQIEAHWFEEGQFWNVGANGYQDAESFDDPEPIEIDPHCLSKDYTEQEVIAQMEMMAQLFFVPSVPLAETETVTLLLNGNEVKTLHKAD